MTNRVVTLELHSDYCGNCAVCAGRQVGVIDERERIIKLLESFDPRIAIGDILPLLIKGKNN